MSLNVDDRSKMIISIIQKQGPITKTNLIDITKMKLSTLNRIMNNLINEKIIVEVATGISTGGRKPSLFDVNENGFYLIGIDISRTYIQIVVTNLKMNIVAKKLLMDTFNSEELDMLIPKYIRVLIEENDINEDEIIGIGFGVIESINKKNELGSIFYNYTDGENNKTLCKRIFNKEKQVPIYIDNGANAAVIGEYYFGSGKGIENVSYFNCGVGIRVGAISSGTLIRNINNTEDAFAHMIIDMDGEACSCGNYGCVESYCSIVKIRERFTREIKKGKKTKCTKTLDLVTYIDICNLADEDDEVAKEIISDAAIAFGTGLANYINMLNPQLVILNGPLIKNSKLFYEVSKEIALRKCHLTSRESLKFIVGGYFDGNSMSVGAAAMTFQRILNNI